MKEPTTLLIGGPTVKTGKLQSSVRQIGCNCPSLLGAGAFTAYETIILWPNSDFLDFGSKADWSKCKSETMPEGFWRHWGKTWRKPTTDVLPEDIRDVRKLALTLLHPNDPVCAYIAGTLTESDRLALDEMFLTEEDAKTNRFVAIALRQRTPEDQTALYENAKWKLARRFTQITRDESFYGDERFKHVRLRPQTRARIQKISLLKNKRILNRLLLEDTFSRELVKIEDPDPSMDVELGRAFACVDVPDITRIIRNPNEAEDYRNHLRQKSIAKRHECITAATRGSTMLILLPVPSKGSTKSAGNDISWLSDRIFVGSTPRNMLAVPSDPGLTESRRYRLLHELNRLAGSGDRCLFQLDPDRQKDKATDAPEHIDLKKVGKWGDDYDTDPCGLDEETGRLTFFGGSHCERWKAARVSYELTCVENRAGENIGLLFETGSGCVTVCTALPSLKDVLDAMSMAEAVRGRGAAGMNGEKPNAGGLSDNMAPRGVSRSIHKARSEAGKRKATVKDRNDRKMIVAAFRRIMREQDLPAHSAAKEVVELAKDFTKSSQLLGLSMNYPDLTPDAVKRYAGVKDAKKK